MPLAEVQDCMIRLARGDCRPIAEEIPLTPEEKAWLNSLKSAPGLSVTADIQSWWRLSRLAIATPLTVELLKRQNLEHLIIDYLTTAPVRTLFFAAEAEQFKQFLHEQSAVDVFTKTTAAYECAMKNASQLSAAISNRKTSLQNNSIENIDQLKQEPGITPLYFDRNPLKIFQALLTAQALPEFEREDFYLLVAPHMPNLWCKISAAEYLQLITPSLRTTPIF
jgi:hypothetical protein